MMMDMPVDITLVLANQTRIRTLTVMTYEEWTADYLKTAGSDTGYGMCAEATQGMHMAFPELTRVRGHVDTPWGLREHWWLQAPDGTVVDPTSKQFPAVFEYLPWKEGDERRLGKCMNCGNEIWGVSAASVYSTSVCDSECYEAACSDLYR